MPKKILVVGGAGYIGSHMLKTLANAGMEPLTLDNLSTGHSNAVHYGKLVIGDMGDRSCLDLLMSENKFDAVIHFASFSQVSESVTDPALYYKNNVANTLVLLDAMLVHGINNLIFSSTAAIFGEPQYIPIDETHPANPINPYGRSKRMVEQILEDYDHAYGLKSVCLRYFNAAGADPDGEMGERHSPETHLIPLVLQAASGRRAAITIFGDDYNTPDGTCIRDYIHVNDLCSAHLLAIKYLWRGGKSTVFNLGSADGASVRQVIETAIKTSGSELKTIISGRRPGDPSRLIADSTKASNLLGWQPKLAELADIIEHAWQWEKSHPISQ